jgi:integrase
MVLFATLACSGLRCGEAFGLHVEDLDLKIGKIAVKRSVWKGQELSTKSRAGVRTIDIEPALAQLLSEHLAGRTAGRVFQTRAGTPFSKGNVRRKLRSVLTKLGLPMGGLHAFRHGRVSVLQTSGVPGDLVKEWIGHTSLRMTSRYTHFNDGFRKETANATGLFKAGPNGPNFGESTTEVATA